MLGGAPAKCNAKPVQKMARVAKEVGGQVATSDEARHIPGLKGIDGVNNWLQSSPVKYKVGFLPQMLNSSMWEHFAMAQVFKDLFDLSGQVALVTGGSGGLGGEVALAFADYGADVVISSRRKEPLEATAGQITERTGRAVEPIVSDVTKEDDVKKLVRKVVEKHGKIDILANFAGMNIPKAAEEYSLEDWRTIMDANATSVMLTCREAGKTMIPRKKGKIINVSSVRGEYGLPKNYLGYTATKAAVNMITRQLACEWAKHNILVNAVAPTVIETALTAHLFKDEAYSKSLKARIPLGRWGKPSDVVGCALFFASKASDFVTGQIVYVDGGVTTW